MTIRKFPLWSVLAVVLVVALVVGSGVLRSAPPSASQRALAIESVVRCPSCEDLSVATSSAPTALTVRSTVRQLIAEGRTDQQVKDYLVARYGPAIVLEPPASGWSLLVWLLPLLGGLVATAAVAGVLVRRRHAVDAGPAGGDGTEPLDGAALEERRRFLRLSLADADAEYLAGDLSDKDYLALRHRDMLRLAALELRTAEVNGADAVSPTRDVIVADPLVGAGGSAPGGRSGATADRAPAGPAGQEVAPASKRGRRSRRSRWYLGGAVAAFGAALVVGVSLFATNRLPGQTPTGSVSLTQDQLVAQSLTRAAALENQGQAGQAAQLYQSVLDGHPSNEVALAQLGWLEYQTGRSGGSASLIGDARAKLNQAVRLDPGDPAARLYLGTVLWQRDGNAVAAAEQYRRFLADGPPPAIVDQAAPLVRQVYQAVGLPVPPQVAGS
ncbi:MAG TPA: cytochrome c-type biogenesis protein CcmH [Acidimicrobiales bacterium]